MFKFLLHSGSCMDSQQDWTNIDHDRSLKVNTFHKNENIFFLNQFFHITFIHSTFMNPELIAQIKYMAFIKILTSHRVTATITEIIITVHICTQ